MHERKTHHKTSFHLKPPQTFVPCMVASASLCFYIHSFRFFWFHLLSICANTEAFCLSRQDRKAKQQRLKQTVIRDMDCRQRARRSAAGSYQRRRKLNLSGGVWSLSLARSSSPSTLFLLLFCYYHSVSLLYLSTSTLFNFPPPLLAEFISLFIPLQHLPFCFSSFHFSLIRFTGTPRSR